MRWCLARGRLAIAHPAVVGACDAVLGRQRLSHTRVQYATDPFGVAVSPTKQDAAAAAYPWQLHLTQIIDIGPGETPQSIHRDKFAFLHDFGGEMEVEVSTMWALTDFTEINGATRVIPGSHREEWRAGGGRGVLPTIEADTVPATMPKGSVLIYTGR